MFTIDDVSPSRFVPGSTIMEFEIRLPDGGFGRLTTPFNNRMPADADEQRLYIMRRLNEEAGGRGMAPVCHELGRPDGVHYS